MNSVYPQVNDALSLIQASDLPHPSGALLSSFVNEALDPPAAAEFVLGACHAGHGPNTRPELLALVHVWTYIVESISRQRGSAPPAPDRAARQAIIRRDGARCCISGRPGRFWDPLVVAPILPIPTGWIAHDRPPMLDDMLGAFFGPPYRDWWLSHAQGDEFIMPHESYWLVSQSAAHAFARGLVKLSRLQPSMVEYEVLQQPIGPESPMEIDGERALLGDRSRAGIPKVDPRFVGTHARLSRSIQYIELSRKFAQQSDGGASRTTTGQHQPPPAKTRPGLWHRTMSLMAQPFLAIFLAVWLLVPARARILAYRTLRRVAQRFIEPECYNVQRLPFGLYLKCAHTPACLRNEVNAMRLARQYTSIPVPRPLDFVEGPAPTKEEDVDEGRGFGIQTDEDGEAYLLMSRIPGVPLSRSHEVLADRDMAWVTAQLQDYVAQLRAIPKTVNPDMAICDSLGGACRDTRMPMGGNPLGPFADEAAFSKMLRSPDDPARRGHRIYFTHADLNPRNILVTEEAGGWRVSGIVDWEMAGYYPEYWEYTKSLYEGFRWSWRYNNMMHGVFKGLGEYSREFEVEKHDWESGI